jgi:hypothetical protein
MTRGRRPQPRSLTEIADIAKLLNFHRVDPWPAVTVGDICHAGRFRG